MWGSTGEVGGDMKLKEKKGDLLLMEDTCFVKLNKMPLSEKSETVKGQWKAPIWNLGKLNLNGRVYTRELGERIVKESLVTGAYDGHDSWDKEYADFKAICKDPWIENDQLWVNIHIIDEKYEEILNKCSDLGMLIGVSSVGYGEEDMDGVVNATTYELVRYLDFVTTPAGSVYAKRESVGSAGEPAGNLEKSKVFDAEKKVLLNKKIEAYKKLNMRS